MLGQVKMHAFRWYETEESFKRSIKLGPSAFWSHFGYANYLIAKGQLDEAIIEAKRTVELDPLSSLSRYLHSWLAL
jgi:tetratricopeptide (TPR) repeat protein